MLLSAALELFKTLDRQRPGSAVLLVGNARALHLAAAWLNHDVRWDGSSDMDGDVTPEASSRDLARAWSKLWLSCEYDVAVLALMTGVTVMTMERLIAILRLNRLIFPDGSVSQWAQAHLRHAALSGLKRKSDAQ